MELFADWRQEQTEGVLLSEYTCQHGEIKAIVKMLSTQRWVACILGHKIYRTKHFRQQADAQKWAQHELENETIA